MWERIKAALVRTVRVNNERKSEPSAAIIDSQSVKTSEGGEEPGIDVHKQTPGRKRHIRVDTLSLLLIVLCIAQTSQMETAASQPCNSYSTKSSTASKIAGAV